MKLLAPSSRRVRSLRLRSTADEHARRGAIMVSDALHTATLPDSDGAKFILIRRIALGRIDARASSNTIALQFERAARDVATCAVHASSTAAPTAPAVYFNNRGEALLALARRLISGPPPCDWFWAAAFPNLPLLSNEAASWINLLDLAHAEAGAAVVAGQIASELLSTSILKRIVPNLPPGQCSRWLRQLGFDEVAQSPFEASADLKFRGPTARVHALLFEIARTVGPEDPRIIWLATLQLLAYRPALAAHRQLPTHAHRWIETALLVSPAQPKSPKRQLRQNSALKLEQPIARPENFAAPEISRKFSETDGLDEPRIDSNSANPPRDPDQKPDHSERPRDETQETDFAGLYFVIPVLHRIGFAKFLSSNPALLEENCGARWLRFCGARVGARPDDPIALSLGDPDLPLLDPAFARDWLRKVRRWCRVEGRIGLHTLICRRGRVNASRMHIDVLFPLHLADARIRRAGLDIDPGWIPWLGKVVRFHYLDPHE